MIHLDAEAPRRGRRPSLHRQHLEGMLWILRTGAPWRDLPEHFGKWSGVYASFSRWTKRGLWQRLLDHIAAANADQEYLLIDSTSMRVHAHACGPVGGQLANGIGRSRAGLSSKLHFACEALGYPLGFILTAANTHDYNQAKPLLNRYLRKGTAAIMDKGYDGDSNRNVVGQLGGIAVIARNASRVSLPAFDQHLYRERHRIENTFARLKAYRRVATRYDKLHSCFCAMVCLACLMLWLRF